MAISTDLLSLLADPETKQPLALATSPELEKLRRAVEDGRAKRRDGRALNLAAVEGALLSADRRVAYLIEGSIPNLLIDERLELEGAL